jgi:hypothetical protein
VADPSLQGSLASFKLTDLLTLLSMSRKSGTLTITSDGRASAVAFMNGSVVYAGSNQEKLRLSAILLRKKKITHEQFGEIDALMRNAGGRFGQIAVQQSVMTEDQLRDWLKVQVSEVLYDAFVWTSGTFSFSEEVNLPDYAVTISVDLPNLIMEGARRIEQWEQCLELLPDSSIVFRVVSTPKDDRITLSADEWKILFLINGQRTLADLVREADDDPLVVYRSVYGLEANKLIERTRSATTPNDTAPSDDTMRQTAPMFHKELTLPETALTDDTSLLVSDDANLAYRDVAKALVAQLVIVDGEHGTRTVALTEAEYLLGRQRDNTIQLTDLGVSGYHARIFRSGDGYTIEDMKSRNGTWVNGIRVFHAILKSGDAIRLGATDLKYEVLFEG